MQLRVVTDQPWDVVADVLAVPYFGEPELIDALGELDRRSGGELRGLLAFGELTGKRWTSAIAAPGELPVSRLLAIAGGPADEVDREIALHLGAAIERRLGGRTVRRLAVFVGDLATHLEGGAEAAAELVTRGVIEGGYEPQSIYREKVETAPPALDDLVIVAPGADASAVAAAAERGRIIGEGANTARTLANRASNDLTPIGMADQARSIAERNGLWIDVIEPERARELGMGMFLAVGQGSDNPPRMIVMRSGNEGASDALGRRLAIVGKGVCFDSGGISIKPSDRMEEMKLDKTGASTVIAAIETVARLAPGTPLLAIAPAVENMPGSHSTRPGDVVRALNGKVVEINNTDAGTPQSWVQEVQAAASRAGERFWQIPLVEEYMPDMDSWYADFLNASPTAEGGLVKSGLFLKEFATVPWVHLDIGGTGYFRKPKSFAARGANGVTHATLVELALAGAR